MSVEFLVTVTLASALLVLAVLGREKVKQNKEQRRRLDVEPVDFDDWKYGSPTQPIPERAKAIDPWEATDRPRR